MDEPLVCCILPYHIPGFVAQATACFQSQTYQNKRLISADTSGVHKPVGWIRNNLIAPLPQYCLIAHWDHDDWSCPARLAEQVALIQSSGVSIVGYRDMPFYDVRTQQVTFYRQPQHSYALGTSLMYWRSVWEKQPFIEVLGDEDSKFEEAVGYQHVATASSLDGGSPRMVARIHPGNTSPKGGARYEVAKPELAEAVKACLATSIVAQ